MSQFIEMFKDVSCQVSLEDVVIIKDECRKPINDGVRSTMKTGDLYPYYGATGVVDYINDYITDEQLLCIAEDCGNYKAGEESSYIIKGKAWVNNHAHIVKPKESCSIEYLHQYLKITNLMPYVSGTTRLKLTQKKLKEIPVILPSKERQSQFVTIAEQADKSGFVSLKSQFIEMFDFYDLNLNSPSNDFDSLCCDDTSSASKIPAGSYLSSGKYSIYDQSKDKAIAGYTNEEQGLCKNYPAVLFGDHSRVVKFINEPFFIGADGVKILRPKTDDLLPEFLYYDLKYHNIPNTGYNRHFKYIKMISLTQASKEEQQAFLNIAHQADKSGYVGFKSIDTLIKCLINNKNILCQN